MSNPSRSKVATGASSYAVGASLFAAIVMITVGVLQFLQGLVALVNGSKFFVNTPNYVFEFDATTWGWIHIVLGAVLAVSGFFIFTGNVVARGVGVGFAALSAIANFLWLPYYPIWSIVLVAIDIVVIWGLTTSSVRPDDYLD